MSKIILSGAKVEEEFLEAVRFYEQGPTFFLFNIKIRHDLFEDLDNIEISFFNQKIFEDQFGKISENVSTKGYKYYDDAPENIGKGLYNYQTNSFGKNTVLGYKQSSGNQDILRLKVNKRNIYNSGTNSYKLFIPIQKTRDILNAENNAEENSTSSDNLIRLRLFIKSKENRILWDSGVLLPFKPLQELVNGVQESLNLEYLTYYIQNTLESANISYTGIDQQFDRLNRKIKVSFSQAFQFRGIGDVLSTNNARETPTLLFNLYYDNIMLKRGNSIDNRIGINYLDNNEILFSIIDNSQFIKQISEDYYAKKENFVFNLTMQFSNNSVTRDIPQYTIVAKRSDDIIKNIIEEINVLYTEQILNKFNINFDFVNLGNRKIKHIINTEDLALPLSEISMSKITQRGESFYNIYAKEDNSETISLNNFDNLEEIFNELSESDSEGNRIFYTYGSSTSLFGSSNIDYSLTYKKNDFELLKNPKGTEILDEKLDIQELNFLEVTKEANRILKNNTEILFFEDNLNLNVQNPMIRQIKNIKISNTSQFSNISNRLGYDNVSAFLSNSIVKLVLSSKFNLTRLENYGVSYYYNFSDVFNVDSTDTSNSNISSIVDFNLLVNNDLVVKNKYSLQFLDSLTSNKLSLFNTLKTRIPNFYYQNIVEIYILPVHNLVSKYKNKGLEENLNVSNYFDLQEEANSVNKIFYDMFYDNSTEVSFTDITKAKESYFKENSNYKEFYDVIDEFIFLKAKSESSSSFYNNSRKIDANEFIDIINLTPQEETIISEPSYAYDFSNRMFNNKVIKNNTFPKVANSILSNIDHVVRRETDILILQYSEYLKFDLNFIKGLGLEINQRGLLENTSYDIRLNLVPFFLYDEGELRFDETHDFFESISYNGKNCITLKPAKYKKEITGYEEILYKGILNNNISIDDADNFSLILNTNHKDFDFVGTDIYKNYYTSGIIDQARALGYTKIYELALNVCLLLKTSSDKDGEKYFSEYYQIKLLNNSDRLENSNNVISIDNIRSIIFKLK